MKHSPEDLEKIIHQTLRSLPDRRAPRSLESRVLAAIEARAALPWWKQSFLQWPVAARIGFLLLSGGLVKVALIAAVWAMAGFEPTQFTNAFSNQFAWIERISAFATGIRDFGALVFRNIPALWLYGTLALIAGIYAALFGLGATAYRTLYSNR
jgi:hypothetical protein